MKLVFGISKLSHISMKTIQKALAKNAISNLPSLPSITGTTCADRQSGKQTHASHKQVSQSSSTRILERLHLDFMGPMQFKSLGGNRYDLVIVDDFFRYTWVPFFFFSKSGSFITFQTLCLFNCTVRKI